MTRSFRSHLHLVILSVGLVLCSASTGLAQRQMLETRAIDLKDCIQLFITHQMVITDQQGYLKAIRSDAGRPRCLKEAEQIDFEKNSLIGIDLDTGYCEIAPGLRHAATRDDGSKQIVLRIAWSDPDRAMCRALSSYYLWVLVPKIPDGFQVKFELMGVAPTERISSNAHRSLPVNERNQI